MELADIQQERDWHAVYSIACFNGMGQRTKACLQVIESHLFCLPGVCVVVLQCRISCEPEFSDIFGANYACVCVGTATRM